MNIMTIMNVVLTCTLSTIMGIFISFMKNTLIEYKCLKAAQCTMIRDRIVQSHDYFCSKGYIGKYSLFAINDMYRQYERLGGNGFIQDLMKDINNLPIKYWEEKE